MNLNHETSFLFGEIQWKLLEDILIPLHSPNIMVEWRDQIPVLQVIMIHDSIDLTIVLS